MVHYPDFPASAPALDKADTAYLEQKLLDLVREQLRRRVEDPKARPHQRPIARREPVEEGADLLRAELHDEPRDVFLGGSSELLEVGAQLLVVAVEVRFAPGESERKFGDQC